MPTEDLPDDIEFAFTLKPDSDPAIGQYVIAFEGHATAWDDGLGDDRPVGNIRGHRIDLVSALLDGLGQAELLESLTPEIADFALAVLSEGRCLLPAAELSGLAAEECDCIVYIAELWVEPDFRGAGIGTTLLRRLGATIDLAHCLIALKALPLREDHAQVSTDAEVARVKRFYTRNGFTHAQGEYMVKDARLCEAIKKRLAGRQAA
jgi:GNAT superfamily N-acetyltransferase